MPKGKYTRKQGSLLSILEVTGTNLPQETTVTEIKVYLATLPEDLREQYRLLYRQYMSIGRPEYTQNYNVWHIEKVR